MFLGTFRRSKVAVKRVQLINIANENEGENLNKLNHPNIVKLFHIKSDDNFKYNINHFLLRSKMKMINNINWIRLLGISLWNFVLHR